MGRAGFVSPERDHLAAAILEFIRQTDFSPPAPLAAEQRFNELALALFRYQHATNVPYGKLCSKRGVVPDGIATWQDIPAVMTTSFKHATFFCGNADEAAYVFHTSGTTQRQPGKHYLRSLEFYQASALRSFAHACLPDVNLLPILVLGPAAALFPHSSLGHMFSWIIERHGKPTSAVCFSPQGIDYAGAEGWLKRHAAGQEPVLILATSLALLDFVEHSRTRFTLPPRSRVVDTGGYKGKRQATSRNEYRRRVSAAFGIEPEWLFNEYGMTELSSQYYETRFLDAGGKVAPPWLRTIACDPETLAPLPDGRSGVLRHFDLANIDSVLALQTEDTGRMQNGILHLTGRDTQAEPRGCSLLAEEVLRLNL